ncbi:MAG: glycosyltransferase family 25 protein [Hyphomicrobiales bacterium]|nr:glycosyltransferase family 25 protein [Hyphomicrobiales bacterium]MCP5000259.1 glycosyltransferase family 25 protein [Hyphomicrobiales bacterium]
MNKMAFIIHLARAAGRTPYVDGLIENCPIETEIVDAIDGKELSSEDIAAVYKPDIYQPRYPFTLRPAEIGCFLSHRICWQKIIEQDLAYGLVFEDDAGLDAGQAKAAIAFAEQHIADAGYIQLPVRAAPDNARVMAEQDGTRLLMPDVTPLRLSGQLISNRAANRLLHLTKVFDRPVDTFLQMHWITKIAPLVVAPSGLTDCTRAAGGSTIGNRKSLIDRANREVRRIAYRRNIERLSRRHDTEV